MVLTGLTYGQSLDNKSWSIDYATWDENGQPPLYIDCGNDDAFNLNEELTIELWVRAYTFAENRKILGKIQSNDPFDNGYIVGFENLHIYSEFFNPSIQQVPRPGDGPLNPDSAYMHIVTNYSVANGKIKNYMNGTLVGETDLFPNTAVVSNDRPFIIGNAPWDLLSFQFYGDLDEIRVWNKTLTVDEIKSNMHILLNGDEDGLVAYYNFNNASGDNVPDESLSGYTGTLFNSDHASTNWATSGAPVGNEIMSGMTDVAAAWYRNEENDHKVTTDNGILVITDITDNEFRKYLVVGHTNEEGTTSDNAPETNPAGFERTNREWYINNTIDVNGSITFDLEETLAGSAIPEDSDLSQYALLYRGSENDDYQALANPTSPIDGIFQFFNLEFLDGYYALGYSTEAFEIQTNIISTSPFLKLKVSPIPSTDIVNISGLTKGMDISIRDLQGKQVYFSNELETEHHVVDISNYEKGMYFITIRSNNYTTSKKIIKD